MFKKQPTTMAGLVDQFTAGARAIKEAQEKEVEINTTKQEELNRQLAVLKQEYDEAQAEVAQATQAVMNIGELLGVKQS